MAKAKSKPDVRLSDMRDTFLKRAGELWDKNIEGAMTILEESESRKVGLTFPVMIDFAESTAKMTTKVRFSQVFTDVRQDDFEDPTEPFLEGITTIKRGAKSEGGDPATDAGEHHEDGKGVTDTFGEKPEKKGRKKKASK